MIAVNLKETNPTKKGLTAKEQIFLGICLFVGMNYVLVIGGFFIFILIVNFFTGLNYRFSIAPTSLRDIVAIVGLGLIFLANAGIFLYLLLKRPLMSLGILAVIPALVLLWVATIIFLLICVVVLYIAMIVGWIVLIVVVKLFPFILLLFAIIFMSWFIVAAIKVSLLSSTVAMIYAEKSRIIVFPNQQFE